MAIELFWLPTAPPMETVANDPAAISPHLCSPHYGFVYGARAEYIQMSKPAALDSDSDHESSKKPAAAAQKPQEPSEREMDALTRRMQAQRLEAMRTGELQKMQDRQKRESARERQRREEGRPTRYDTYGTGKYEQQGQQRVNPDLADLDFGAPIGQQGGSGLQRPLSPDSDRGGFAEGGYVVFFPLSPC